MSVTAFIENVFLPYVEKEMRPATYQTTRKISMRSTSNPGSVTFACGTSAPSTGKNFCESFHHHP